MKGERWLPIPGWEGFYEASDLGHVRSLTRTYTVSSGKERTFLGRVLKLKIKKAHVQVELSKHTRKRAYTVHLLVLMAFVGPRPVGMECRHLNGDFRDNRLENLAWGTRQENADDKKRHGTDLRGERSNFAKRTEAEVLAIREAHAAGESVRSISERTGVPKPTVRHIVSRYSWQHLDGAP